MDIIAEYFRSGEIPEDAPFSVLTAIYAHIVYIKKSSHKKLHDLITSQWGENYMNEYQNVTSYYFPTRFWTVERLKLYVDTFGLEAFVRYSNMRNSVVTISQLTVFTRAIDIYDVIALMIEKLIPPGINSDFMYSIMYQDISLYGVDEYLIYHNLLPFLTYINTFMTNDTKKILGAIIARQHQFERILNDEQLFKLLVRHVTAECIVDLIIKYKILDLPEYLSKYISIKSIETQLEKNMPIMDH